MESASTLSKVTRYFRVSELWCAVEDKNELCVVRPRRTETLTMIVRGKLLALLESKSCWISRGFTTNKGRLRKRRTNISIMSGERDAYKEILQILERPTGEGT